jgi:hypothetical protein
VLGKLAGWKDEPVVRAAVSALGRQRSRHAVSELLGLLSRLEEAKDRGLIYQETRDALYAVTSMDYDSLDDWKKWWEPQRESWEPGKDDKGATRVERKPREQAPEFAGKKLFSRNLVFVIDTSGTMQYVLKPDIPGLTWFDGSDGAKVTDGPKQGLTPENSRLIKFWRRVEVAKRELVKAIGGLAQEARVNVIEFNKLVRPFEKQSKALSAAYKKQLIPRVERLDYNPLLGTNTLEALQKAFECDPRVAEICFLSDGLPSAEGKKKDDPMPLLEKVERLNRFRKVKIHTFGFDPRCMKDWEVDPQIERANEFLLRLAEGSGGSFTLLKATDEKPPPGYR